MPSGINIEPQWLFGLTRVTLNMRKPHSFQTPRAPSYREHWPMPF